MIEQLLRYPLPDQIKALIEKIESEDDTSSLPFIEQLVPFMRPYERYVFRRALRKAQRARLLNRAMEIVIDRNEYEHNSSYEFLNAIKRK
jgi:hypothetical protein